MASSGFSGWLYWPVVGQSVVDHSARAHCEISHAHIGEANGLVRRVKDSKSKSSLSLSLAVRLATDGQTTRPLLGRRLAESQPCAGHTLIAVRSASLRQYRIAHSSCARWNPLDSLSALLLLSTLDSRASDLIFPLKYKISSNYCSL